MKPFGYILFIHYKKCGGFTSGIQINENFHGSMKSLLDAHNNEWDDKWDVDDRDKIDYFYLDLSTGEYHPLPKFKNKYKRKDGFETDHDTVMSKSIFKNKKTRKK